MDRKNPLPLLLTTRAAWERQFSIGGSHQDLQASSVLFGGNDHKREMLGASLVSGLGSLADGAVTEIDMRRSGAKPGVLRHTASKV